MLFDDHIIPANWTFYGVISILLMVPIVDPILSNISFLLFSIWQVHAFQSLYFQPFCVLML